MRILFLFPLVALAMTSADAFASSDIANPLFGYTHIMPSPFTLHSGTLAFGTDIAYGVTDFLQVGTNLVRDVYKVYNGNAKVSLVDYPAFAAGMNVEYEHFNYHDFSSSNPDYPVDMWRPGISTGYGLIPRVALFLGGNLRFANKNLNASAVKNSGFVQGGTGYAELSWAYNPPKKKASIGNVLSGGISYDFDYKLFGFGLSHHWPGFHLGLHYYPSADFYKLQPIIAGGGSIEL